MEPLDDTIAAIASPPGGAARGMVRVSGPEAVDALRRLFQPDIEQSREITHSHVTSGTLRLPILHSPLPCDIYFWPEGRSYTGQPVVEIHTLGSPPLLDRLLQSICAAGARLANPGEFTLRAFLAGRIDLTQAEAVLGVIDANDSQMLGIALNQLAGGLARPMHQLRESLLDLLSHLEAGFDFADEDLTFITRDALLHRLAESEIAITDIHRQMSSRGDSSDLPRVTLFGRPNTGKSSLFNALVGHDAAMVSHYPGTTRDYLAAMLDFDGAKCLLIDTAGARDLQWTGGAIDDAAESVTAEQRRQSQLPILCIDSSRPLDPWEREQLVCMDSEKQMVVLTKCDLPRQTDDLPAAIETSGKTGRGMNDFRLELRRRMLAVRAQTGDAVAGTAVRCDESLRLAGQCLATARRVALDGQDDLAASEIRGALVELGKIVGTIYTDDVLDRIFSRFCVGK